MFILQRYATIGEMTPQLSDGARYIIDHRAQGIPDAQIRAHFAAYSWTNTHLDAAFAEADTQLQPTHHTDQPAKYTVFHAINETLRAINNNWQAFLATLLISLVVLVIGFGLIVLLLLIPDNHHDKTVFNLGALIGIIILAILIICWYALSTAFLMATTAKALRDGAHNKHSSIKQLLLDGLHMVPRTAWTNAVGFMLTMGPLLLLIMLSILVISASFSGGSDAGLSVIILGLGYVFAFAWFIVASLRLSLVQQVAVFEPELSTRQVLKRSSFLLQTSGQWFIIKGGLLVAIIEAPFNALSDAHLPGVISFVVALLQLVIIAVSLSTLTMLYFNRAAVRGHSN